MAEKISTQAVTNLIINKMNAAAYFKEKDAGRLKDNEVYIVEPDKQGESVDAFYKWLKERNYDMDNFRGLESIFPVVTLQSITVDKIDDGDTVLKGSAPPNITLMYGGKTTTSDNGGRWEITGLGGLKQGVITIDWIDYAGRKKSTNVNLVAVTYCVPEDTGVVTRYLVEVHNLNRAEKLWFPPSVKKVATGAFRDCANVTEIIISNCEELESSAFNGCSSLTRISLPKCTSVGGSAFNGCSALTNISLPACASIESYAFYGCNKLRTVILSDRWTPSESAQINKMATVYNQDKTKKVNWNTMSWVNV
ncbi:leucine-rich repeat domain-containing protein [Negativicoccus succinicivorans]|uniref:leucine-rich repeat domain-containing protein n=1 Tax=Negativicoccus succinicivorans TaxID=620903 RepID=UPI0029028BBD|nr:leucine-rich repeat domain-containing protein [Negativicoccus succinicivorans]MDU2417863.1 leucine-rich repeat domain-containing protein [Negativicoccus succinicivorans]